MRHAARTDNNHAEIREGLRACGVLVFDTARVAGGFPDLVCCHGGRMYMLEVKQPGGKLTPAEQRFHDAYDGYVDIVYSLDDALCALGLAEGLD